MPKTPRFVAYQDKQEDYIIHLYHPRLVAKVCGNIMKVHEAWEDDIYEVKQDEVLIKMAKWWKYRNTMER